MDRSVQKHSEAKEKGEKLEEECRSLKVGFNSKEEFVRKRQVRLLTRLILVEQYFTGIHVSTRVK